MRDVPFLAGLDQLVRNTVSAERYAHSRAVAELAADLGRRFGVEPQTCFAAGLAHDMARELPAAEILDLCGSDRQPVTSWERANPVLLHGRAAAVILRENGYDQPDVLQAIEDHVTGRPGMGALSKILFASDFLEPTRDFLTPEFRERTLGLDLDAMVLAVLKRKIQYVESESAYVAEASISLLEELSRNDR